MTAGGRSSQALPERGRTAKGTARRSEILRALEELLRDRHLHTISIGDIAAAAGVSRSTFYFYFPTKEAATAALLDDVFAAMAGYTALLDNRADDPEPTIRDGLTRMTHLWIAHEHLLLAIIDARTTDPAVGALWERWMGIFTADVAEVIERQRGLGRATPGPDARILAQTLIGMNERALERDRRHPDPAETEQRIDALVTIWVRTVYGSGPTTRLDESTHVK